MTTPPISWLIFKVDPNLPPVINLVEIQKIHIYFDSDLIICYLTFIQPTLYTIIYIPDKVLML